jgi:hypothetical protein
VYQWSDASGSGNNATQSTSSAQPTFVTGINFEPALNFSSSSAQFMQLPSGFANFTSGASIFIVAQPNSPASNARLLDLGNGTSSNNLLVDQPSSTGVAMETFNGSSGTTVSASSAVTNGQFQLIEALYNGSNTGTLLVNGTQVAQNTSLNTLNNTTRLDNFIGQASGGGNYFNGQISEVLVFNRQLTSSEQSALESALIAKYQLLTSYSLPAPTISVASGSLAAPTQICITAPAGATIYVTTDGSTPTTSSQFYPGPMNITYSQTVKSMYVIDGVQSSVASATYTLNSTQWPAPSTADTTPLRLQLHLPSVAVPQDANQH